MHGQVLARAQASSMLTVQPVGIFWDIENCAVPHGVSAHEVAVHIRTTFKVQLAMQGPIRVFSAYADFSLLSRNTRQGCQKTGISLIDIPHGNKDAADKAILADMFLFALDNPPPCTISLISGDVDFAPALHKLGQRGYSIVLAIPSGIKVSPALCNACQHLLSWPDVARGKTTGSGKTPSTSMTNDVKPVGMDVPSQSKCAHYFKRRDVSFMSGAHCNFVTGLSCTQNTSEVVTRIADGISEEQVKVPFDSGKEFKDIPLAEDVASHGTCRNGAGSPLQDMHVGEIGDRIALWRGHVSDWFNKTFGGSYDGPVGVPCVGEWRISHDWKGLEHPSTTEYEHQIPHDVEADEAAGVCNMGHKSANREAENESNGRPHLTGPVTRSQSACKKSKTKGPSVQLKMKKKKTKKVKGDKTVEAETLRHSRKQRRALRLAQNAEDQINLIARTLLY